MRDQYIMALIYGNLETDFCVNDSPNICLIGDFNARTDILSAILDIRILSFSDTKLATVNYILI